MIALTNFKKYFQNETNHQIKRILQCCLIKQLHDTNERKKREIIKVFPFLKKYKNKQNNKSFFKKLNLDKKLNDLFDHEFGISDKKEQIFKKSNKKILIIGGGISSITSFFFLRKYFYKIRIFEKNNSVGGTWYKNNYPGSRVDVPNRMYCFSFNQNFEFKNIYSNRNQMLNYIEKTAKKIGYLNHLETNKEVKEIKFENFKWNVKYLFKNKIYFEKFDYVICATGQLSVPKKIEIKKYTGKIIHPSEWKSYLDISNKRILMIGNAASAVQIATSIYNKVKRLDILYQTNNWFHYVKHYKSRTPSKLHFYFKNIKYFINFFRVLSWKETNFGHLKKVSLNKNGKPTKITTKFKKDLEKYFKFFFGSNWKKFTPNYDPGSKRILLDNGEWAKLIKNKKINLIKDKIKFAKNKKIFFKKKSADYDIIITATGFSTPSFFSNFKVIINNKLINKKFNENPVTYCGIFTPDLPNFAFNFGPNTNGVVNGNTFFFSEVQSKFYSSLFYKFSKNDAFKIKKKISIDMQNKVNKGNKMRSWSNSKIRNWYKNKRGLVTQNWPFSLEEYWKFCKKLNIKDFNIIS